MAITATSLGLPEGSCAEAFRVVNSR